MVCAVAAGLTMPAAAQSSDEVPAGASEKEPAKTQERVPVECRILYETADGFYVDVGTGKGLRVGSTGVLLHNGNLVARVEAVTVSSGSAFLRVVSDRAGVSPGSGAQVVLVIDDPEKATEEPTRYLSPTLKNGQDDGFTPLLTPPLQGNLADPQARNVFHGKLTSRNLFQTSSDGDLDYLRSRLGARGSVERLGATPWSLDYSLDLSYRDGDALEEVHDHQEVRTEVYRLAFSRRFDDDSSVRVGRFIPGELPSAGYLDGFQGEKVMREGLRLGVMLGTKPTRDDLDFTDKEPTLVLYGSLESGDRETAGYSGTLGLLTSAFNGKFDRSALLWDQSAHRGAFSVFSSSEIDFDIGASQIREDFVRLTRWNLSTAYEWSESTTLRAGLDKFEIPDTEAERDFSGAVLLPENEFFGNGYWRFWVGASHQLPWNLSLREEASFTDSEQVDDAFRWSAGITRTGLPGLPSGRLTLDVYNLVGDEIEGYGGRLSGFLPLRNHSLTLQPSVAFRFLEFDTGSADFLFVDVALHGHWQVSRKWNFVGGVSYALTDDEQRLLFDVGVTLRW